MKIRKYKSSDLVQLEALYRRFFTELRKKQGWKNPEISRKEAKEITSESIKNSCIFVAEEHSKLVGFSRIGNWEGTYFVREVFVEEPYRRRGVGNELLISCEKLVREKGESSIFLTVEPKNSVSINFLRSNGYDTLNMLELRKDLLTKNAPKREDITEILGHRFRLLKRS
jgi:ribosomal protein S18 acetylase RimI-like enzyme